MWNSKDTDDHTCRLQLYSNIIGCFNPCLYNCKDKDYITSNNVVLALSPVQCLYFEKYFKNVLCYQ